MRTPSIRNPHYLAAAVLLIVSFIDVFIPVQFVVDILYLCAILIVFKQDIRTIIGFSIVACLLIIINVSFFDLQSKYSITMWVNRGISIIAICITSYIVVHYKKITIASLLKEQRYSKDIKEMLFITSHRVRRPVASILGLIDVINMDGADLTPTGLKDYCQHLNSAAIELDSYIRELNEFIAKTDKLNQPVAAVQL